MFTAIDFKIPNVILIYILVDAACSIDMSISLLYYRTNKFYRIFNVI